jgi:hypothetical protein
LSTYGDREKSSGQNVHLIFRNSRCGSGQMSTTSRKFPSW